VRYVPRSLVISTLPVLCVMWSAPALVGQAAVAPPLPFEEVAAKAARAREAGTPDEAIRWYRRGVRMRPRWDEGWWYMATLLYERDRYAEAAAALERFLILKPDPGPALALRGLCEFQVKDYVSSLRHLGEWMAEGSVGNDETRHVAWYHLAILRIRGGQFELALEPMTQLCRSGPESPRIVRAVGLMLLRLATFPAEVPLEKEELVDVAGRAAYSWLALKVADAQARFKELIERFPEAPNAHYCYGLFLLGQGSDEALAQFREEMRVQTRSAYPRLETAFELLKRGDYAGARPYAEDAVRLAPGLFAAHNALGRVLVELGEIPRGVTELEEAARLAPDSPEMFFALAQAYGRAGRKVEAAQAKARFQKLEEARRAKRIPK
jgi:tetratricopeptide (TPR) repeat protein